MVGFFFFICLCGETAIVHLKSQCFSLSTTRGFIVECERLCLLFYVLLSLLSPTFTSVYKWLSAFTPVRPAGGTFAGCYKTKH